MGAAAVVELGVSVCVCVFPWFLSGSKAAHMGSLGVLRGHHLGCLPRPWWWRDWGLWISD